MHDTDDTAPMPQAVETSELEVLLTEWRQVADAHPEAAEVAAAADKLINALMAEGREASVLGFQAIAAAENIGRAKAQLEGQLLLVVSWGRAVKELLDALADETTVPSTMQVLNRLLGSNWRKVLSDFRRTTPDFEAMHRMLPRASLMAPGDE